MEGNIQGVPPSNGYVNAPPPYQQSLLHDQPPKPKSKSFVYGCGGICGATIFVMLLVGILRLFAAFSLAPGLFIMWLLYWKEHRAFADLNRLVKFFAAGVIGVLPVALIEYGISILLAVIFVNLNFSSSAIQIIGAFTNAFLIAAFCEETFKYFVASRVEVNQQTDSPYSLLLFGAAGAVGLATLENMMYIVTTGFDGSLASIVVTTLARMFLAVPLHATTGVLIGADLAEVKFGLKKKNFFEILLVPFLLHGMYDFFTMMGPAIAAVTSVVWFDLIGLLSIVVVIVGVLYAKKRRQQILALTNQQHSYQPLVYSV